MAAIPDFATYEQELTYTCYTETNGAHSCFSSCTGFVQDYTTPDAPIELSYVIRLRLNKNGTSIHDISKTVVVKLFAEPSFQFGANPLSH